MTGTWKDVPSAARLEAACRNELTALAGLLAAAEPGQSVHGSRRRIKQLRSLLRLLRPALGDETFAAANAALREAADALAGHRRAEALVAAASKLEGSADSCFWRRFAEAHQAAHAAEENPAAALIEAQNAISRAEQLLALASPAEANHGAVANAFLSSYAKARKRLRHGLKSGNAVELHEARKYVIHHLHQLKFIHPRSAKRLKELEQLREALGDLNDLDELEKLADPDEIAEQDARGLRKARAGLMSQVAASAKKLFHQEPMRYGKRLGHARA